MIRFCEGSSLTPGMTSSACTLLRSLLQAPEDMQEHASALYRHTCAMFGTKNFNASLDEEHGDELDNRATLRSELMQVVTHLYSLFSIQELITKAWVACPFNTFLSLCSIETCRYSVYTALHGLARLVQTQPVFLSYFEQQGGWNQLRGMLLDPGCANDPVCYRILFACLLGRQLHEKVLILYATLG